MTTFLSKKLCRKAQKACLVFTSLLLVILSVCSFFSCRRTLNYFDYVSELRNNIFLAETEEFSLHIYSVVKENPYATDGIAQETSPRFEAYLLAPEGTQTTNLTFQIEERTFGGEMSYDNVKGEYTYFCTLNVSKLSVINCLIKYGEKEFSLSAKSVLTETTLPPNAILQKLIVENSNLFEKMTDKYGFAGEIYLRLIYEDSPYYYIGIIDREGNSHAFLMNAETGKILARRET